MHARITDRRRDHLHKLTTRIVRDNQTIVIEDLTVRNMVKNRRLARAISDAAWRQFRTMLEYKVASRMGVSVARVTQIEAGDVSTQDALACYIAALGGTLKLIADFGDEQLRVA